MSKMKSGLVGHYTLVLCIFCGALLHLKISNWICSGFEFESKGHFQLIRRFSGIVFSEISTPSMEFYVIFTFIKVPKGQINGHGYHNGIGLSARFRLSDRIFPDR